jgi:hypothetical protein
MKTTKTPSHNEISAVSTKSQVATTKEVFLDEYFFTKTDIGRYELIIVLRPREFQRLIYTNNLEVTFGQNHSNELFSIIKHYLAQENSVEKILFLKKGDIFHIWSAMSNYHNPEVRKSIYSKERDLMNFLSRANFHFDFFLVEPDEVDELLSAGATVMYDKEKHNS